MTNLSIRNSGQTLSAPSAMDPFRVFDDLMRWDPFTGRWPALLRSADMSSFVPSFEVKETKDNYVFKADLPGVEDKDVDITVTGNTLTISGKREAEHKSESDTYHMVERTYGSFSRSFTLPDSANADQVKAELRSGVLTLCVPKKPEHQPRKISIKTIAEKVAGALGGKDKPEE